MRIKIFGKHVFVRSFQEDLSARYALGRDYVRTIEVRTLSMMAFAFILLAQQARAQNFTSVTASNLQSNVSGTKVARGQACMTPTDNNDQLVTVHDANGIAASTPSCATVTAGVIAAGYQVANPASTTPAGIYYRFQVTDQCAACATRNQIVIDLRLVALSGASFNLDSYIPSSAAIPTTGTIAGPLSLTGSSAYWDMTEIATPANPLAGIQRWFASSSTHQLGCLTSAGANCNPGGGGGGSGTVTQVTFPTIPSWLTASVATNTTTPAISVTATGGQTANQILATPDSTTGAIGLRLLVANDIPALAESKITNLAADLSAKLAAASNLSDLANAATARTNLGLGTAATHAQTDFSGVGACAASNWVSTINGNAAPTCTRPAYSDLTGTPTLFYQTVQNAAGADQTQRGKVEFTGTAVASVVDDSANNRTVVTLTASAGSGVTLQTNGVNDSSQTALNLKSSAAMNGVTLTQTNTAGGDVQLGMSGTLTPGGGGTGVVNPTAHLIPVAEGSSNMALVPAGTAGQVLVSQGSGADPAFADPITSGNQAAATTQTITATGAKAGVTVTNIGQVLVTVSGTYAGVAFNFEATPDGTFSTAFPVQAVQVDANAIVTATGALPSNATRAWFVDLAGFTQFRVNATAFTSGTANVTITPIYFQFVPLMSIQANSSINETQLAGTAVDVNSGTKSAGTQRVVLATDQPALTNALKVDLSATTANATAVKVDGSAATQPINGTVTANIGTGGSLATDASVAALEVSQGSTTSGQKGAVVQGAVTTNAPTYTTAQTDPLSLDTSGLLRVSVKDTPQNTTAFKVDGSAVTQPVSIAGNIATTDAATSATGSAVPAKASYIGGNSSGNLAGIVACDQSAAINVSTATTAQIVAISGTGGRTYICSYDLLVAGADNVTLISGSGTNCASNVAALIGGSTAAAGYNFAANGGISKGDGIGMVLKTTTTNNEVCVVTSAAVQLSGSISYTQF